MFLAYEPAVRAEVLRNGLVRYTENTVTDPEAFTAELERIRAAGSATSYAEARPEVATVSAPVLNQDESILAVITVGGPLHRATPDYLARLRGPLLDAASAISRQLGWLGR